MCKTSCSAKHVKQSGRCSSPPPSHTHPHTLCLLFNHHHHAPPPTHGITPQILACARIKRWWMAPCWPLQAAEVPSETQIVLVAVPAPNQQHDYDERGEEGDVGGGEDGVEGRGGSSGGSGGGGGYAVLLPLVSGSFRATLFGTASRRMSKNNNKNNPLQMLKNAKRRARKQAKRRSERKGGTTRSFSFRKLFRRYLAHRRGDLQLPLHRRNRAPRLGHVPLAAPSSLHARGSKGRRGLRGVHVRQTGKARL